jgi:hypothetical protein
MGVRQHQASRDASSYGESQNGAIYKRKKPAVCRAERKRLIDNYMCGSALDYPAWQPKRGVHDIIEEIAETLISRSKHANAAIGAVASL